MELTAWQKICHRVLGKVLKKRARGDKTLSSNLVKGAIPVMPEVFVAQILLTSFAILLICWAIVAAFFFPNVGIIDFYESIPDDSTAESCLIWERNLPRSRLLHELRC